MVIFPYVDLKHLHSLEIFTAGHNVVDLESTALHNLKELLEFESTNSYSQSPSLFFIYNLDKNKVKEVMSLENIRCVLNVRENVPELVNGSTFIFYNKKNSQFLNLEQTNLDFEEYLISSSGSGEVLQDIIQKIKVISSRIFAELNQDSSLECLPELLKDFDEKYWRKILDFTEIYYDIEIPNTTQLGVPKFSHEKEQLHENVKDYSDEYTILVSKNKAIGKEFIQLLHDYRIKKVNSSHLGLGQLFNPLELYNYLRNHHWKEGIPPSFTKEWSEMKLSQYKLTEQDQLDFDTIIEQLSLKTNDLQITKMTPHKQILTKKKSLSMVPSSSVPISDWKEFQQWIVNHIEALDRFSGNKSQTEPKELDITPLVISSTFSQTLQDIFRTAEGLFKVYKNDLSLKDASLVIAEYGKGLETVLHEKISPVFNLPIKKYHHKFVENKTSVDFDKKFKNLMTSKSVTLGTWVDIIEKRSRVHKSEETKEFYMNLNEKFDKDLLETIKKACIFLSPWRNRSVHNKTIALEKVATLRERTIQLLNPVIIALYDIPKNSPMPSILDFNQFKVWLLEKLNEMNEFMKH